MLVDLTDREADRLAGLGVVRDELAVVGGDHKARAEANHIGRGLQLFEHSERVTGCRREVDDLLLRDLRRGVGSNVQTSVA